MSAVTLPVESARVLADALHVRRAGSMWDIPDYWRCQVCGAVGDTLAEVGHEPGCAVAVLTRALAGAPA